jgi:hypothetical protein
MSSPQPDLMGDWPFSLEIVRKILTSLMVILYVILSLFYDPFLLFSQHILFVKAWIIEIDIPIGPNGT